MHTNAGPAPVETGRRLAHHRGRRVVVLGGTCVPHFRSDRHAGRALALAALLLTALAPARAEVILHAFNWRFAEVTSRAPEIARLGYRAVLVSPPQRSEGTPWYQRYQPQDYRVVDSPLGTLADLRAAASALRAHGVALHVDVVFNHMANEAGQRGDLDYPGARVLAEYLLSQPRFEQQLLFGDLRSTLFTAADFHPARCITDYNDPVQVRTGRLCGGPGDAGLPDLAATPRVLDAQRSYLRALRALGATGFRVDAAKHMDLAHLGAVFTADVREGATVYGEIITGGGEGNAEYRLYLQPYLAGTDHAAYDFPLFHATRNALSFGARLDALADAPSRGQALPGGRAITFAVNHDIPLNGIFRGLILDPVDETLAWAWVIGRGEGTPLLYSDHDESGDRRWVDLWRRPDIAAMVGFHNATRRADYALLSAGACHLLFRRGDVGLVGINKCAEPQTLTLSAGQLGLKPLRTYREVIAGGSLTPGSDGDRVVLPPRATRMWLVGK
jgi:alpha-amylase